MTPDLETDPAVRTLYVLRHAKSSWDEPVADHERGLAPRGRRALGAVADHLEESGVHPDLVLCSSARRAVDTLEPLLAALDDPVVRFEGDLYGAGANELIERLRAVDDDLRSVMLVGHNPGLQDLILTLVAAGDDLDLDAVRAKFPTAALATLELGSTWSELDRGTARLVSVVRPRDLAG